MDAVIYEGISIITRGKTKKVESEKSSIFYFYREVEVILILAFIGGFVDAVGYIKCSELFTSSITGNLVAACSSVYLVSGVVARVMVSLAFVIGGITGFFTATKLKVVNEWKVKSISILLYSWEVGFFLIAFSIGLSFDAEINRGGDDLSDWRLILTASFMGGTMGMHNAAAKESIPNVPATTVMTMTLVSESMTLAQVLSTYFMHKMIIRQHPVKELAVEDRKKLHDKFKDAVWKWIVVTRPLAAFLIGALIGCVLAKNITYFSLLLPPFLISTVVVDIYLGLVVERRELEYSKLQISIEEANNEGKQKEAGTVGTPIPSSAESKL